MMGLFVLFTGVMAPLSARWDQGGDDSCGGDGTVCMNKIATNTAPRDICRLSGWYETVARSIPPLQ
jgi:hypothetical protein